MKDIEVRGEEEESDGTATGPGSFTGRKPSPMDRHTAGPGGGSTHQPVYTHTHTHNCKTQEVKMFDDRTMKSCQ